MNSTTQEIIKQKRNAPALRRLNQDRLKQINDIYIETQLTISGLLLKLHELERNTKQNTSVITVPSMRGKEARITRNNNYLCRIISDKIKFKEYVQSLIFAITLTESYLSEMLIIVLRSYPEKLLISTKGNEANDGAMYPVDMKDILKFRNFDALIMDKAEHRVREVIFATPKAYAVYINKVLSFNISNDTLEQFSEIKATRDIYVHGDGIANKIYELKAGKLARGNAGQKLVVDGRYLKSSLSCMKDIFTAIFKGMNEYYGESEELANVLANQVM